LPALGAKQAEGEDGGVGGGNEIRRGSQAPGLQQGLVDLDGPVDLGRGQLGHAGVEREGADPGGEFCTPHAPAAPSSEPAGSRAARC